MCPAPHSRTPILSYSLKIEPESHFINWQQDPQGNYLARLVFNEPTIEVLCRGRSRRGDVGLLNPFDFFLEPNAEDYPFTYDAALTRELRPFLEVESAGPELTLWLRKAPSVSAGKKIRTVDFLIALNQRLQRDIGYGIRTAGQSRPASRRSPCGTGSRRDSTLGRWCRSCATGPAARFVSRVT